MPRIRLIFRKRAADLAVLLVHGHARGRAGVAVERVEGGQRDIDRPVVRRACRRHDAHELDVVLVNRPGRHAADGIEGLAELDAQFLCDGPPRDGLLARAKGPSLPAVFGAERELLTGLAGLTGQVFEVGQEPPVDGVDAEARVGMAGAEGNALLDDGVGQHLLVVGPLDLAGHLVHVIQAVEHDCRGEPLGPRMASTPTFTCVRFAWACSRREMTAISSDTPRAMFTTAKPVERLCWRRLFSTIRQSLMRHLRRPARRAKTPGSVP